MIDEDRTMQLFGYTSDELKPMSNKKIVRVCDECGRYKVLSKIDYHDLCASCAQKNRIRKPKIVLNCQQCGKTFEVIQSKKDAKFCSQKCMGRYMSENNIGENNVRWKGGEISKTCDMCGIKFSVIPSRIYRKFCSVDCYNKYQSINALRGESSPMFGTTHTLERRIKSSCLQQGISVENFDGFLTEQTYCSKFDNRLKTQIRDKYNNCDYISGIHKDVCNPSRELDVHHVDYNKQQGCDDHEWRLIPLSRVNHMRTNANRSFWNRLFTYALQYDETYYTSNLYKGLLL